MKSLATLLVVATAGVLAQRGDDDAGVWVVDRPPGPAVDALAIVSDQIWIGGEGFVARGDGSQRMDVPGRVMVLAVGDLLWAAGEDWVAAIDPAVPEVLATWEGEPVGEHPTARRPARGDHRHDDRRRRCRADSSRGARGARPASTSVTVPRTSC